ncbi:MAG: hypothetical protein WD794_05965 [Mycobacteriales bacterium]
MEGEAYDLVIAIAEGRLDAPQIAAALEPWGQSGWVVAGSI